MTPVVLVLAALLSPWPFPRSVEVVGGLRHLQLLEARDLEAGHLRFATSFHHEGVEEATGGVAVTDTDGFRIEASLRVPYRLVPLFSWTRRRPWALLELAEGRVLVALDGDLKRLYVYDFPSGTERGRVTGVYALHDVRRASGELLVERGEAIELVRLDPGGLIVERKRLATQLDSVGAAAFVHDETDGPLEVLIAGWSAGVLSAALVEPDGTEPRAPFPLADFPIEDGKQLRCAALRHERGLSVAVGQPGYRRSVGRIVIAGGGPEGMEVRYSGRPDPEVDVGRSSDQCRYGQALTFVNDEDGDDWPDLVVCGPWGMDRVDLLSGASGERLARFFQFELVRHGYGVCTTPDRRHVLVGGGGVSYPENLEYAGGALLLRVRDMQRVQRWERSRLRVPE